MGNYEIERAQRDEVIQNLKREGVRRGYSGDTLSFFIVDGLRAFDRQKQELAKQKHELEMRKIDVALQGKRLAVDAALESERLEVGGQRLALERRKLELKERSKKNELEDLIEIEEKNLLRDKMLVERKYFGRHVVIDTEWQKLERASQGRVWKFERECWIEIEERRQELDKMQVELENRAEANNHLIQEIESQYYGGRPFEPSLVFQNLRAPAIEFFQRVNNYSHEAENFQTTSQQTTNAMEIGDSENGKDDVEDSSADDDGEEKKERDSKAGSETHHLPEKEPLVESTTEFETQQKNEEEKAKVEVEKTELTVEEKPPEKIGIKQIQGHADDFEPALPQPRNSIDNRDDEDEDNNAMQSSADSDEEETNEQNGTTGAKPTNALD
ncbi:hypothetical protein C0Q70_15888 [Pomacea canaliculata]|uniref:Uncharacterized protein n=1 Tax=Pomacea canaliculata TaxID=400727 RepID=A0A2T7NN98_POMCA|nr:hypothetical protein C0Q70_15888 [Pomacea canaliculata]